MNIRKRCSRTIAFAFMLFLGLMINLPDHRAAGQDGFCQPGDWDEIISAFKKYWEYPSPENAKSLLILLPVDWPSELANTSAGAIEMIIAGENYGILDLEALAGDSCSTEVLIRLLAISDGWAATQIKASLGTIIRVNPTLFLSSLWPYRDKAFIKRAGYAANGPNYAYNNHPSAFQYDLHKRIEALNTVTDSKYADIKEAIIEVIREELEPQDRKGDLFRR